MAVLIPPCGGNLVDLTVRSGEIDPLKILAGRLPSIQLPDRGICDLELLATGAFSPLDRFMTREDHRRVVEDMRLSSGNVFPIPVTLPVSRSANLHLDQSVALRDAKNEILAVMTVEEIYEWDKKEVAHRVFGTNDLRHPLISEMKSWGEVNISGHIKVLQLPHHYDFRDLRLTPAETRATLERLNAANVVAFQTRNPLHRAHEEVTKRAMAEASAALLLHPVVGLTKPGDVDHYTRVRAYKALLARYYDPGKVLLALLPLAMRLAGPREALWHALIRRNYGANYFIVGRDHASPGTDSAGKPFYGPYDAQELAEKYSRELGIAILPFGEMLYLPDDNRYEEVAKIPPSVRTLSISGTQVREHYLNNGRKLP